ncbi:MAG TPA: hypothetical protein VMU50_20290 [Polyangia bacterium]|nr:hypothetical protein [Polyangia bacterium]
MTIVAWGCATSDEMSDDGGQASGRGGAVGTGGSSNTNSGSATGTGGSGTGGVTGTGGSGTGGAMVIDAGSDKGGGADTGGGDPNAPATFTELWNTIFSLSPADSPSTCAGAACHNPKTNGAVNVSNKMMAYMTVRGKVMPNKPDASSLVTRLESKDPAKRMPLAEPALSAALKLRVRSWIMNGAKND